MADIRLILTDIDGTILPAGREVVSERCRAAFHAALDAGIRIGPASGRGFAYIPRSFAGDAALSATCLATNGMQVYLDGTLVHQELLPPGPIQELADAAGEMAGCGLICFEEGQPLLVCGRREDLAQSFRTYAEVAHKVASVPDHGIEKANVFCTGNLAATEQVCATLERVVAGRLGLNVPMPGFLNVTPVGWSKATGIDLLCDLLHITLEQVAVFGDGGNDVEMLSHVPNSFAVAAAAPSAARAARYHIGDVADDAVAEVVERIVCGTWRP